ncbi:MAG TPA: hypothetical protein VEK32_06495 [Thermodesulfobacteriota bacterium]|nr:hypothetical protein [Thermodesulfobacteriota bacterium]
MFKICVLAAFVAAIAIIFKSPWFEGWTGEIQINLITKFFLSKDVYHLIKNVGRERSGLAITYLQNKAWVSYLLQKMGEEMGPLSPPLPPSLGSWYSEIGSNPV